MIHTILAANIRIGDGVPEWGTVTDVTYTTTNIVIVSFDTDEPGEEPWEFDGAQQMEVTR